MVAELIAGTEVKINYRITLDAQWHGWSGVYLGMNKHGWAVVRLTHNGCTALVRVHPESLTLLQSA